MSMDSNLVTFAGNELIQLADTLTNIVDGIKNGGYYSLRITIDDEFHEGFKISVNHNPWGAGLGTMLTPLPGTMTVVDGEGTESF